MSLRGVLTTKQSQARFLAFTRNKLRNDRGELLNNLVNLRRGLWLLFRGMRSRGGGFTASGGDTG